MNAFEFVIIAVCFVLSGFFSGIETGMISINRLRLRHLVRHKVKGAAILQDFLAEPDHLLGTTLVGNNIVNTVFSVMMVSVGTRLLGDAGAWTASILASLMLLVFCEYLPKLWFQSFPSRRCLPFAPMLYYAGRLLYPVSNALMKLIQVFTPFVRPDEARRQPAVTREEVLRLVREGQRSGVLSDDEVRMIGGVFDLQTMRCREIMIPRSRMVHIHHTTSREDILMLARAQAADQFPVFDTGRNTFVGVVYLIDVLSDEAPAGKSAKDYMRPPQLVASDTPVDHVLPRMRVTRQPIVLVADEKQDVIGYITLDDVVDEIVG